MEADIMIVDTGLSFENTDVEIEYQGNKYRFISSLLEEFNIYNLCGAIGDLVGSGYDMSQGLEHVADLLIDNRMQRVNCGQDFEVIVDFAHNINGYANVLSHFNQVKKGKIITIGDCVNERPEKILYEMTNELDNTNYCFRQKRCNKASHRYGRKGRYCIYCG